MTASAAVASRRRVVVTGVGVVTPFGGDGKVLAQALLDGASAAGPITLFDASGFITRIAAEVPAYEVGADVVDRKAAFMQLAARRAVEDSRAVGGGASRAAAAGAQLRSGASIGLGLELFSMPDMVRWRAREAAGSVSARIDAELGEDFLQPPADRPVRALAQELGLATLPRIHVSACAASTDAIGRAFLEVRAGRADWMLAGGADSMINPMGLAGFCKIEAMTTRNADPKRASRPFDMQRDGFLLGEGAAFVVLEPLDLAQARGARVWAEVLGYGNAFDAYAISDPHPEGEGAWRAMRRALDDARLPARDVRHVNAHGTSTPKNDPAEAKALKTLFRGAGGKGEDHLARVSVNATKSMLGHAIGASGAIELAAQLWCARLGWRHGSINLEVPDADARALCIPAAPTRHEPGVMLKNSFAFGGQNACLALALP
jgi:3-oxoacyl-[acyl-carrier-protein] synthase II